MRDGTNSRVRRFLVALVATASLVLGAPAATAQRAPLADTATQPVALGRGGAAASVDELATAAAISVLRRGGDAVDAAVAASAVLGVVEPYSCGIGGGGFMVIYRAGTRRLVTIDAREVAPRAFRPDVFLDPATGRAIPFAELVTSGLGVGVPGTVRGWEQALRRYGRMSLRTLLAPAIRIARNGFVVDQTFSEQTAANAARFRDFTSTRALFLTPSGEAPAVGTVLRNPDLARTYELIARRGARAFYAGSVAQAIVDTVKSPPLVPGATRNVRPGVMEVADVTAYRARWRPPTRSTYRGLVLFGMGPPSSGGSTIGEALNILEGFDLRSMERARALHLYLEASRLAFADRGAFLGDPEFVTVPLARLLSKEFAAERRALIGETAASGPVAPGGAARAYAAVDREGMSTTHLTVSDRRGNVVSYTFTIEQTGGSGIVVPGYGFLLNNELTDFETTPGVPNSPAGGKRPRSSMSPTIVFSRGRPLVTLGSPGGSTIITTVLQVLVGHLDLGMTLPEAVAAPRISQRNTAATSAEPAFLESAEAAALRARGHAFTSTSEIGALTGIRFLGGGRVQAVAEPTRRGGGSAMVVTRAR